MAKGWEIVEKRGDGLWYTNMRTYVPDEGIMYRNWVLAHDSTRYFLREVEGPGAPTLASSVSPMRQQNPYAPFTMRSQQVMDESKARRIGQELAASLVALFEVRANRDGGAQYALGRTLAAMTGEFENADLRDAFIEGIMAGFRAVPAQIASPRRDIDGDA